MKNIESIAQNLFDKIRTRFNPIQISDENNDSVIDETSARFFNFNFITQDKQFHTIVTISIIDKRTLEITFTQNIDKTFTKPEHKLEWIQFLKSMRKFAKRNLLNFNIKDINKSNLTKRDINQQVVKHRESHNKIRENFRSTSDRFRTARTGEKEIFTEIFNHLKEFDTWTKIIVETNSWSLPDSDDKIIKLRDLMSKPIKAGENGIDAKNLLYDVIGSETLETAIETASQTNEQENTDIRPQIVQWLNDNNYNELAKEFGNLLSNEFSSTLSKPKTKDHNDSDTDYDSEDESDQKISYKMSDKIQKATNNVSAPDSKQIADMISQKLDQDKA